MDVQKLFSTYKLLPPSPAWSSVEKAMRELEGATNLGDEDHLESVDMVRRFAATLRFRHEDLAKAVACSAFLGTAAEDGSFGERAEAGLDAIATSCGFTALTTDNVVAVTSSLYEVWQSSIPPVEEIGLPDTETSGIIAGWRDWIGKLQQTLRPDTWDPTVVQESSNYAWREMSELLLSYLRDDKPDTYTLPGFPYLVCAVRKQMGGKGMA